MSREPDKYVEDAVRRGCGAQAQHFDKAMREDMEKHRSQWNVWCRIVTMQYHNGGYCYSCCTSSYPSDIGVRTATEALNGSNYSKQ